MYRLPAEWEPQAAVQITFPHSNSDWADQLTAAEACFCEIIIRLSAFVKVMVVCQDFNRVQTLLGSALSDQIELIECPSNDTWARDHGGIMVAAPQGWQLLDFTFNGWGQKFSADLDNQITQRLHNQGYFGQIPLQQPNLVLEGGSIESDGEGTILTTSQCLLSPYRNPDLSKIEIEDFLNKWLGAERVLWLEHGQLVGDDTDAHIDTLARFCSTDRIAYVRCDNPDDPHYDELQRMELELQSFRQANGQVYHLIPLPWPSPCYALDGHRLPATYANFLITNGAILLPIYGLPEDQMAIDTLQAIFPKHALVPVNCRVLIEQHGSLHCVTMQYPSLGR